MFNYLTAGLAFKNFTSYLENVFWPSLLLNNLFSHQVISWIYQKLLWNVKGYFSSGKLMKSIFLHNFLYLNVFPPSFTLKPPPGNKYGITIKARNYRTLVVFYYYKFHFIDRSFISSHFIASFIASVINCKKRIQYFYHQTI